MKAPFYFSLFTIHLLAAPAVLAQGSLTPPGAPGATMKTLEQVEPRRPISSLPFIINQRGSYYLTGNLQFSAASGNAININVSDVTLDLMGFTLSSTAAVTGSAIRINAGLRNIEIRNGAIVGNTTVTTDSNFPNATWTMTPAGFEYGIELLDTTATDRHFRQLRIVGCRTAGLQAGSGIVEGVTVTNCALGIDAATGSVSNSTARLNYGVGIYGQIVSSCNARENADSGIVVGQGGSVAQSNAQYNGQGGIVLTAGSVSNSAANFNETHGISGSGTVTSCNTSTNGSHGIFIQGVIAFCRSAGNNQNNDGSVDIQDIGATRTGNNPAP